MRIPGASSSVQLKVLCHAKALHLGLQAVHGWEQYVVSSYYKTPHSKPLSSK